MKKMEEWLKTEKNNRFKEWLKMKARIRKK